MASQHIGCPSRLPRNKIEQRCILPVQIAKLMVGPGVLPPGPTPNNKRNKMSDWFEKAMAKTTKNPETGCWEFAGEIVHNGYGRVRFNGKNVRLHRLSYTAHRGEIPSGMLVCHKCDVRNCWNPDHLFVGTDKDNVHDMMKKGRLVAPPDLKIDVPRKGERNPFAKFTEADVREMRRLHGDHGLPVKEIAARYGASRSGVSNAISGRRWGHVV